MSTTPFDEKKYKKLLGEALPCAIHDDTEYERLLGILDTIERKAAEQEISSEEERLSDLLFALIQPYEEEKYKDESQDVSPLEHLKLFMEDRDLKQKNLWHIFGSKGVTSEVLNGKRQISKTHAKRLAEFFNVEVGWFI